MPIYFRCDAGSRIGLGHLIRSLALAQMLRPAFEAYFLIREPETPVADLIRAEGFDFSILPQSPDYPSEAQFLKDTLLEPGDLVVLDGYHFDTPYQQILRQKDILLACIDDLQAFSFEADLIINQAGGVDPGRYQALPHTRFCLGPAYALLRLPFLQAAQQARTLQPITRVLLNMGGADPNNDTCRILKELLALKSDLEIAVVTGSAYTYGQELSALVAGKACIQQHQNLSGQAMCQLMQSCQAAILPPSVVSYEWCSVGGPLFLYQTADNQAAMKAFLLQENLARPWEAFAGLLQDEQSQQTLQHQLNQQRKYFGGQSPARLRSAFNQLYFNRHLELSPAGPQDMTVLFEWANDPTVRENSFNQAPIPLEVHKIWFENKLKDTSCLFLVARLKDQPVGMIRYDLKQQQAVISYLIGREFRGRSLGTIILQKGEALLQELHPEVRTIIGQVQESNLASQASFRHAAYELSATIAPFKPGALVFEKHL